MKSVYLLPKYNTLQAKLSSNEYLCGLFEGNMRFAVSLLQSDVCNKCTRIWIYWRTLRTTFWRRWNSLPGVLTWKSPSSGMFLPEWSTLSCWVNQGKWVLKAEMLPQTLGSNGYQQAIVATCYCLLNENIIILLTHYCFFSFKSESSNPTTIFDDCHWQGRYGTFSMTPHAQLIPQMKWNK